MKQSNRKLLAVLGPGILYTAAAVGVSHLVYATRAGAVYGLAMIPFYTFILPAQVSGTSIRQRVCRCHGPVAC